MSGPTNVAIQPLYYKFVDLIWFQPVQPYRICSLRSIINPKMDMLSCRFTGHQYNFASYCKVLSLYDITALNSIRCWKVYSDFGRTGRRHEFDLLLCKIELLPSFMFANIFNNIHNAVIGNVEFYGADIFRKWPNIGAFDLFCKYLQAYLSLWSVK